MIERVSAWIQRVGRGAATTPWSFVRIHLWALVALVVVGAVLGSNSPDLRRDQYNRIIDSPRARVVALDRNDQRGFDPTPNSPQRFDVAWIGGSSLQSISDDYYEFLPALTREEMGRVDDQPVDVDIFFLSGIRIIDEYVALLAALESRPDMIVFALNPVWVLNDGAIQGFDNLDGLLAADVATDPSSWLLGGQTLSPADALFGLAGSRIAPIRDRWSYADDVRDLVDDWDLLDRTVTVTEVDADAEAVDGAVEIDDGEADELQRIRAMSSPLQFWSTYRLDPPEDTSVTGRQLAFLQQSTTDGSIINDTVLELIGAALREADVPAFVYMAPVDPAALENPEIDAALGAIEQRLLDLAPAFEAPHVFYDPVSIGRTLSGLEFNDLVHIGRAEPLAERLADDLCAMLDDLDSGTCTPKGAPP